MALKKCLQCNKKLFINMVSIVIGRDTDADCVDINFYLRFGKNVGY